MKLYQIISYNKDNKIQNIGDLIYESKDHAEAVKEAMEEVVEGIKVFSGDRLEIHSAELMRK